MRIDEVPRRLGIIGGGFIAVEQGHVFEAFGSKVTMFVRRDQLLSFEDRDVSERVTELAAGRFDLRLESTVTAARSVGDAIHLDVVHGGVTSTVEVDEVLVATGRVPNGDQLGVEATGVALDALGYVITDEHLQTAVEGIWALGDVRSPMQLKHVANHEARVVQHNLLHPDDPLAIDERAVPHAVFGHPQVASVGATQQELEAAGMPFLVGHRAHGATAYGWAMEDTEGFVKVLVDPATRLLLGAHAVGHQAAILLQPLVQAMRFGQTADEVATGQMWPHPALSEVIENALLELR
jgi:mycothione reductase